MLSRRVKWIRYTGTPGRARSRVECAAGHHLLELYGLTDMVEGVLALRVEGEADAYLLKPYRTFFDEVRASDLVKVRFDETPDAGPGRPLNYASCAQARGRPAPWWHHSNAASNRSFSIR